MATIDSKSPNTISVRSNEDSSAISNTGNIAITNAGICMKSNFRLSRSVTNLVPNFSKSNVYDVIFTCGGTKYTSDDNGNSIRTNEATALILDHNSYNNGSDIPAYTWKLPAFQSSYFYDITHILYSNTYGLIKIQDEISRLPFNRHLQNSTNWSWQHINDLCYVKIGDGDDESAKYVYAGEKDKAIALVNDEKLVFCGGYSGREASCSVLLYDIRQGVFTELPSLSRVRCRSGLYMDQLDDKLYIGGGGRGEFGQFSLGYVEYMDMNKCEQWSKLPYTKNFHNPYPVLWIEDGCILYIASCGKDIERLDLRESKEWESVYDDKGGVISTDVLFGLNKIHDWSWRDRFGQRLLIST